MGRIGRFIDRVLGFHSAEDQAPVPDKPQPIRPPLMGKGAGEIVTLRQDYQKLDEQCRIFANQSTSLQNKLDMAMSTIERLQEIGYNNRITKEVVCAEIAMELDLLPRIRTTDKPGLEYQRQIGHTIPAPADSRTAAIYFLKAKSELETERARLERMASELEQERQRLTGLIDAAKKIG